jgi:hypothetical protein
MRIANYVGWVVGFSVPVIQMALAGETNPLIGKWVERAGPAAIITEFTPTTMAFTPVDPTGNPTKAPNLARVDYDIRGSTIVINFHEQGGGGLMATVTDPNSILLIFPGMPGAHKLTRMQPQ